jgi:peptidoglycan/xylan/chitin deacetylase (PgdA/CDA1 family)
MGDKMKHKIKNITLFLIIFIAFIGSLFLVFPYAKNFYARTFLVRYYNYNLPIITSVDTKKMNAANAVPILMYHGVTYKHDSTNTQLDNFISQMEMLKKEGYETITVHDLDLYLQDKYKLPPKPIIITFDDGRKDSYYTTDDVLKKLGFKATMFIATGKANNDDRFFLSWDELREMKKTGRWELEAHGRHSHDKIIIDKKGSIGSYLSSKIYDPKTGLESTADYKRRVEQDYIDGINDIKNNLDIDPKYYAIPLNDYGQNPSNYNDASNWNEYLTKKYFRLAFIEVYSPDEDEEFYKTHRHIYNLPNENLHKLGRIEVKYSSPTKLKEILTENLPQIEILKIDTSDIVNFANKTTNLFGNSSFSNEGLLLKADNKSQGAEVLFGQEEWKNYTIEASFIKKSGRSTGVIGYQLDNNNYIIAGYADNGFYLRKKQYGKEMDLAKPVIRNLKKNAPINLKLVFKENTVTTYVDNKKLFKKTNISIDHGTVGFRIWDDTGKGENILQSVNIYRTN